MRRFPAFVPTLTTAQGAAPIPRPRLAMRSGAVTFLVEVARVERLESAGAYVRVHERGRSFLVRGSLSAVMERLAAQKFVRVHRSVAVAVSSIVEIRRVKSGDLRVVLSSGAVVAAPRVSREELERAVEQD